MPTNANYGFGFGGLGAGLFGSAPVENLPADYYASLITPQYQGSTKAMAWLKSNLQILSDAFFCLAQFDSAFDLDTAVGVQLDVLGHNIGVSRIVGFQPSNGVSPILDDETYRLLLKARIAQNQWDGRISSLQAIWQQLFPGGKIIIEDAQNMTATIVLSGSFSSITQDLITNGYIVPRPQAVLYNYTFSTLPIFGTDLDNSFIAGVDTGHII